MAGKGTGTTRLAQMLYLWRAANRLTLRDVAAQTGISHATIMRLEHGHLCDVETWIKLETWLFQAIGDPHGRGFRGGMT
jgi:transcriptional regulator with XRE-family HTH domain